jgi:hypothetical protein
VVIVIRGHSIVAWAHTKLVLIGDTAAGKPLPAEARAAGRTEAAARIETDRTSARGPAVSGTAVQAAVCTAMRITTRASYESINVGTKNSHETRWEET